MKKNKISVINVVGFLICLGMGIAVFVLTSKYADYEMILKEGNTILLSSLISNYLKIILVAFIVFLQLVLGVMNNKASQKTRVIGLKVCYGVSVLCCVLALAYLFYINSACLPTAQSNGEVVPFLHIMFIPIIALILLILTSFIGLVFAAGKTESIANG